MGFASGFRTGLAAGESRRSMMPIVQGLGSMIDRIERRNKKGSIRFGGSFGESSYDKYLKRKAAEEAAAEEKRRYDQQVEMKREQMATQQEKEAVAEQRTAEMHQEKVKSIQAEREKAQKLFERSEKKEKRIEAYRGFIQGIQSRNKALTEASWAALAPDMPEGQDQDWAPIEKEMIEDPATGEMVPKYVVGRGKGDKKGLPAPSIEFMDDGQIAIQYPGQPEPEVYPDAKTFAENVGYHLNPEFETGKGADKDKKKDERQQRQDELKLVEKKIKRLQKAYDNDNYKGTDEEFQAEMAALEQQEDELTTGKKRQAEKPAAAAQANAYAGEDPPADFPEAKRAPDGKWYVLEAGKWKPVLESEENVAQK